MSTVLTFNDIRRVEIENGIYDLIAASRLRPYLKTLEISDGVVPIIDEENQLMTYPPACIIQPGGVEHSQTNVYGVTNSCSVFVGITLVGINFRGPKNARTHGSAELIGIYEMAHMVREAVRGKCSYGNSGRIFLTREEPGPWVKGGCLYTLTVRVPQELDPNVPTN